jgi:ATP-dependent 26S proteasome regulatory subunit
MAVLYGQADLRRLGEEGRLERVLEGGDVEVSIGEVGHYVFRASAQLRDQLDDGEAEPGSSLVVCPRQYLAWRALPLAEGEAHFRFLSRQAPPDVIVERDVGAPAAFIADIARHIHRELVAPEIGRRFVVRRSQMLLAIGVAGSGKSHSIKALWRRIYEVMAEVVGVEVEDLPQRVFQLQASEVLSKWLGESDKSIARFFDEVGKVAEQTFVAPDGTEWELPVIVICEEIDALARQRGEDSIHDRIQTTLLTKLDPAQAIFEDRMVVVICTSNIPSALDVAFVRRAGGTVERFGRVGRFDFRAILAKHLRGRPFQEGDEGRRRALANLTIWLFAPNSAEPGAVELTFVGQPNPVTKHRRDFVTAGLIDRAIQQAARGCCNDEWESGENTWLTTERLMSALDDQVRGIVDQLTPGNCDQYLSLPDAMRVGAVRRVPQPPVLPVQLERAS